MNLLKTDRTLDSAVDRPEVSLAVADRTAMADSRAALPGRADRMWVVVVAGSAVGAAMVQAWPGERGVLA